MSHFAKPPVSIADQIQLLRDRGLSIPDTQEANHYLDNISYYRLSAYMRPFQYRGSEHRFRNGVEFEEIKNLYVFDKELLL